MATFNDNVKVQVLVSLNTKHGQFRDCLYFTKAEFDSLGDAAIEALGKFRADNWVAFVDEQSSKPPVAPSKEDLQAELVSAEERVVLLQAQIAKADTKTIKDVIIG